MITLSNISKTYHTKGNRIPAVKSVSLTVEPGKLVTLLGPSGCGKTTTLRMIAGLERPDGGEISIDGVEVFSSARRSFVGPHRRQIGMVFQSYAIWPHLTVLRNVMYPLRVRGPQRVSRSEAQKRALRALDLVGLAGYADRPGPELSGGQQQRVALARALVREPKVLLLDEPLSNLDASLRHQMREEIRALQQRLQIATVFVTHDQDEALAISDEVIVMDQGEIMERGEPRQIYSAPASEFTARFFGISNALRGVVTSVSDDGVLLSTQHGAIAATDARPWHEGERATIYLRPEGFRLSRRRHEATDWEGTVEFAIYRGDAWDYHVRIADSLFRVRSYRERSGLTRGDTVHMAPEKDFVIIYPAEESDDVRPAPIPATLAASLNEPISG